MKKLSVFSENCQISFSPPCLSLSLRENERFPIPFWQISEKTEFFTPSLSVLGLHVMRWLTYQQERENLVSVQDLVQSG